MKHIKLFENFSEEEKPKSITIEFNNDTFRKEYIYTLSKNDSSAIVYHNRNWFNLEEGELKLEDGYYYPIYKCITDLKRFRESKLTEGAYIMYLSYDKERNEVLISMSSEQVSLDMTGSSSSESFKSLSNAKNWYTKFVNGCRVGEVDNRGYFKIVEVK
jgi:hypothetical protein